MFDLLLTSRAEKDLAKMEPGLRKKILSDIQGLKVEPYLGKALKASFKGVFSFHHAWKGIQYRTIYQVDFEKHEITVFLSGTRENVYRRLKSYW